MLYPLYKSAESNRRLLLKAFWQFLCLCWGAVGQKLFVFGQTAKVWLCTGIHFMHLQSICAHKFLPRSRSVPTPAPTLCGASCARLRHDQIKAKSKHNGGCLQPFAAANKNLWAKSQSGERATERERERVREWGKVRKMRANKILANNRIIIPKGFAFWPNSAEAWALRGHAQGTNTHSHTPTHTHRL